MSLLEIGPKKFRIWAHRGDQLKTCRALRVEHNFIKVLFERMEKFGWKFGTKTDSQGKMLAHGE